MPGNNKCLVNVNSRFYSFIIFHHILYSLFDKSSIINILQIFAVDNVIINIRVYKCFHIFLTISEGDKFTGFEFLSQMLYIFIGPLNAVASLSSETLNHRAECENSHFKNILSTSVLNFYQSDSPNKNIFFSTIICFSSVQFTRSVVSNSLRPHESQHTRPPCPSPTSGVHSDSRPSSQGCHPAISSSVIPFFSCPQSLPAAESFPISQLFT